MNERSFDIAATAEVLEHAVEAARRSTDYRFLIFFRDRALVGPLVGKLSFTRSQSSIEGVARAISIWTVSGRIIF